MAKNLATTANVTALPQRGPLAPNFDAIDALEFDGKTAADLAENLKAIEAAASFGGPSYRHAELARLLEHLACTGVSVRWAKEMETRVAAALEAVEPLIAEHEGDDIRAVARRRVSLQLAMLVDSFPTSNMPNPKVYSAMLLDDVSRVLRDRRTSSAPDLLLVATMCRRVRRNSKFLPAISEILREVETADREWETMIEAVFDNAETLARLAALRDELKARADEDARRAPNRLLERRL